jgi:hypothetical protein
MMNKELMIKYDETSGPFQMGGAGFKILLGGAQRRQKEIKNKQNHENPYSYLGSVRGFMVQTNLNIDIN